MKFLAPLRKRRDELAEELIWLLQSATFDDRRSDERRNAIRAAVLGDADDFECLFSDCQCCGDGVERNWFSDDAERFFELCLEIKALEQSTYHAARQGKEAMPTKT